MPATDSEAIEQIRAFWFGPIHNGFPVEDRKALWYEGSEALDREIAAKFGELVESALAGRLANWAATADGTMALILLLDQFTRNIYRGSAKAFSGDAMARDAVYQALARGDEQLLSFIERSFLYMPLMHSENLHDQETCVQLFQVLHDEVEPDQQPGLEVNIQFAIDHLRLIEQFGRFPYRNAVLGRTNTAQETDYLEGGGARFGQ